MTTIRSTTCLGGLLLSALVLASCAAESDPSVQTSLRIVVRADGATVSADHTLNCIGAQAQDSSTLPNAEQACAQIDENPDALSPQRDPAKACTEIWGGPQTATISGTRDGQQISSTFTRQNGCAIDEWSAVSELLGEAW